MELDALLERQGGVFSLDQALFVGMSMRTVQRRVGDGAWRRLFPRVYLAGGYRLTDAARVRAASLWAGQQGTVSCVAAAFWHGMVADAPAQVAVTVPRTARRRPPDGIALVRSDLGAVDRESVRGVQVVAGPLAALQAAIVLDDGAAFLDRALQRHVRFPQVYRAYCRNLGSRGWARVHPMLVAAAGRAESEAERLLVSLLRAAGVDGWELGFPFGPYRIDLAFPAAKVAVEIDGWAWHVDVERFRADRRKGNALTSAGWTLLRFTWHDLTRRPGAVVAEVRAALSRRAA